MGFGVGRPRGATGEGPNISGTAAFQRANGRRGNRSPARTSRLDSVGQRNSYSVVTIPGNRDTNYTNCPRAADGSNPIWICKLPILCSAKKLKKNLPKFRLP